MLPKVIMLLSGFCVAGWAAETSTSPAIHSSPTPQSNVVAIAETDNAKSLEADLHEKDAETRMNAVRGLGSSSDPESKRILVDYFMRLPQPEPSSDANQAEKTTVLREVIQKLHASEQVPLLLDTFHEELSALKAAKEIGRERYYPKDLAYLVIEFLTKTGCTYEVHEELASLSTDLSLPQNIRKEIIAAVYLHDLQDEGERTPVNVARVTINRIGVRPVAPIPWDTYNDPQRRVAYSNTETFRNKQQDMGKWLKSDEAVRNAAYEDVLHSLGPIAVGQLIAFLDEESIPVDRRDYFACLASDILRKQSVESFDSQRDSSVVEILSQYVEKMEDDGAFGRRAVAAANINAVCEKIGLSRRVVIVSAQE